MSNPLIILPRESAWELAALDGQTVAIEKVSVAGGPLAARDTIAAALKRMNREGEPVWIALPSRQCLAASLDCTSLPRRHRREAMLYALEERLPVVLEECAAELITGPDHALGIAVPLTTAAPLLSMLDSVGLTARALTPATLLALRHIEPLRSHDGIVILADDANADVLLLDRGRPRSWQVTEHTPESLLRQIQLLTTAFDLGEISVVLVGATDEVRDHLAADPRLKVTSLPGMLMAEHAARGAAMSGRHTGGVIDLLPAIIRRTNPVNTSSRGLLVAAAVAALLIPAALLWRAHQYSRIADDYARQAAAFYEQRFNAAAPPVGILRYYESEWRAVQMADKAGTLPGVYDSILPLLRDAVAAVPPEARLRVKRIHVSTDRLELQGEAGSKPDAYSVQQALGSVAGFRSELTRIEDAGGGECRFTLVTTALPPTKGAGK